MIRNGIRISDDISNIVSVSLSDLLEEIPNGNQYYWSILELEAKGHLGKGISIPDFEDQIFNSENGFFINWANLVEMSKKFDEIIWISIIGSKNINQLHRYKTDREMYETCDMVIEMFDSQYWEIFSVDTEFINQLAIKFKKIEFINSDFQDNPDE